MIGKSAPAPLRRLRSYWAVLATVVLAAAGITGCTGSSHHSAGASPAASTTSRGGSPTATAPGSVDALSQTYETVVANVLPSVVQITTSSGLGSGVVFDDKGDIVTNDHVVGSATTFQVTPATGHSVLSATLVGTYPADDLAVIKVPAGSGLHPARFGDSAALKVGQIVLAMGNPLGLAASVTNGIVSAVGRTVSEPQGADSPGATIADAIQTSAAINPGNSGGALVDLSGEVVGTPTLAATDPQLGGGAAPGIGFAIPSNTVKSIAAQLIATGKVTNSGRAALNATVRTVLGADLQPAGVGIVSVETGGAAAKAGLKPGDVITKVNDTATPTTSDLSQVLAQLKPGDQAKLTVEHPDGNTSTITVTLGQLH